MIAGSARGLKLKAEEGLAARPTLDRVKESMFNMLTGFLPSARALDLFAGSGALGVAALSRGASHCTFVDVRDEAVAVVRQNVSAARFDGRATIRRSSFDGYLKETNETFDLILLDPPYGGAYLEPSLWLIRVGSLLAPDGVIVCEMDDTDAFDAHGFSVYRDKRYGRVRLVLLRQ